MLLRKKARNWPGLHLQGPWLPHPSVLLEKRFHLSPLQRRRRAPRVQRPSLSPVGSPLTLWKAGASPLLPKRLLRPQWAPVPPPLPNQTRSLSLLTTPLQPSHTAPPSLPQPQKSTAKLIQLVLQPQRVQPHQKDPPRGKIKRIMWQLCFIVIGEGYWFKFCFEKTVISHWTIINLFWVNQMSILLNHSDIFRFCGQIWQDLASIHHHRGFV